MQLSIYAIPAILALLAKVVIFFYARKTGTRNFLTRLFVWFLVILSLQNMAEIALFASHSTNMANPVGGSLYFASVILAFSMLLHLVLILVLDWPRTKFQQQLSWWLYFPVIPLELLLWFTPWLVAGFRINSYGYTEIAGPVYFLFELFVFVMSLGILALLAYGSRKSELPWRKLKNRLMLIGLLPPLLVVLTVMSLQHFGIFIFNATVTFPLAVTFFLIVTSYAMHQHRLFDIQFYIPGSKLRRRKTAFYGRIKTMIAEIADLKSISDVINRLADTLSCPVVLVSGNKPVVAALGNAQYMTNVPRNFLKNIDHIQVANEISSENPESFQQMKKYGIAAIVPFYPYSQHVSGWLLLGESFSNQVYTSRDFRMTEQLFEKMADLFLDKILNMRHQLASTAKELTTIKRQELLTKSQLAEAETELASLKKTNERLTGNQLADSTSIIDTSEISSMFKGRVTLLSRDKTLLTVLREEFPQCVCYTGPGSANFKKQMPADVYVCQVTDKMTDNTADKITDRTSDKQSQSLLNFVIKEKAVSAFLIFGEQARHWLQQHRGKLTGIIIDVLPEAANKQLIFQKIRALRLLRNNLVSEYNADYPYVNAQSQSQESLKRACYFVETGESILIESQDTQEAETLATVVHYKTRHDNHPGSPEKSLALVNYSALVVMEQTGELDVYLDNLAESSAESSLVINLTVADSVNGSLGSSLDDSQGNEFNQVIKDKIIKRKNNTRFFFITDKTTVANIPAQTMRLTPLKERVQDQQVLAHYYVLQFNIQSLENRYLSQDEMTGVLSSLADITLVTLRSAIIEKMGASSGSTRQEDKLFEDGGLPTRALDEYVADYEKQLIIRTLKHCGGNKSQAARILGLRSNTLHYKLERFGLLKK